jgi:quercetin dioxygenase-like cupin family protein
MTHPSLIKPREHAVWRTDRMGKSTIFESSHVLVGLNAFEPGQRHSLHAHAGMDKMYYVIEGRGLFLLDGRELSMEPGDMLVAPEGIPHGVNNTGPERLLVLAVIAPGPGARE